jgi:hypothetical protein
MLYSVKLRYNDARKGKRLKIRKPKSQGMMRAMPVAGSAFMPNRLSTK